MASETIVGSLQTGIGQGQHFTRLAWARAAFVEKLGIDPYPGTINILVDNADAMEVWSQVRRRPGVQIDNPNDGPHDCDARCYLVSIEGRIDGAIVVPEVSGYSPALIEVIAAMNVRDTLRIADGDQVRIYIRQK